MHMSQPVCKKEQLQNRPTLGKTRVLKQGYFRSWSGKDIFKKDMESLRRVPSAFVFSPVKETWSTP
eukprot:1157247-Pelagomonas_calceolata.AAC.12